MKQQRGGTFLGIIIGIVMGLGAALALAVYVNKVPIPFLNKGQNRSNDQDAAEAQKNKNWDPNAPLYGKNPVRPGMAASAPAAGPIAIVPAAPTVAPPVRAPDATSPAASADPLGDLAKLRASGIDPFNYFVQAGAYRTAEDAEGQRARLSLGGIEARVSEREQAGRLVYRVRIGPFERRDDADRAKEKVEALGMEAAMVRVQR
ncbi:MAG: SPOR domain-containing protein [Burkholderiaceae bacterium]